MLLIQEKQFSIVWPPEEGDSDARPPLVLDSRRVGESVLSEKLGAFWV
jgi:hypothetical protein